MTTTVSRVLYCSKNDEDKALLRKWADDAASNGGAFAIDQKWEEGQWWTVYTIIWPGNPTPTPEGGG